MEAKDTVIKPEEILSIPNWDGIELNPLLEAQADISFKAGIREVVEIIEDFATMLCQDFDKKYGVSSTVGHTPKGLLEVLNRISKLKEWGNKCQQ